MSGVKNIVLVHGAWADGSSWSKLIPLLQAKGLHAAAVQNPLSSIADDVASTNRLINAQDGPVLLVGHSYGGAVISEAGMNPKVAGLVYVAAFAPDKGETLSGLAGQYPKPPLFNEIKPIEDGFLMLTDKGVDESFAQDLSAEDKALVRAPKGRPKAPSLERRSGPPPGITSRVGSLSPLTTGPLHLSRSRSPRNACMLKSSRSRQATCRCCRTPTRSQSL